MLKVTSLQQIYSLEVPLKYIHLALIQNAHPISYLEILTDKSMKKRSLLSTIRVVSLGFHLESLINLLTFLIMRNDV
ncbi:hypothetical protein HanRHA438_Chr03g0131331 [Helianthus annuus]|nr:hypothetical protein HanRHA438_Chr03g0131331 [Helianthus annuus]